MRLAFIVSVLQCPAQQGRYIVHVDSLLALSSRSQVVQARRAFRENHIGARLQRLGHAASRDPARQLRADASQAAARAAAHAALTAMRHLAQLDARELEHAARALVLALVAPQLAWIMVGDLQPAELFAYPFHKLVGNIGKNPLERLERMLDPDALQAEIAAEPVDAARACRRSGSAPAPRAPPPRRQGRSTPRQAGTSPQPLLVAYVGLP